MLFPASVAPNFFARPSLRAVFRSTCRKDTLTLGTAFAQAVMGMQDLSRQQNKVFRAGFRGIPEAGKTCFIRGTLHGLWNSNLPIERVIQRQDSMRPQRTMKIRGAGYLRWYDAFLSGGSKSSSVFNTFPQDQFPFVDLTEHPDSDRDNRHFDCTVHFKEGLVSLHSCSSSERCLEIVPSLEVFETDGYQRFLEQANPFQFASTARPT